MFLPIKKKILPWLENWQIDQGYYVGFSDLPWLKGKHGTQWIKITLGIIS